MRTASHSRAACARLVYRKPDEVVTDLSCFSFSNLLGFLGQHEQIKDGPIRDAVGLTTFDVNLLVFSAMNGVSGGFRAGLSASEAYIEIRTGGSEAVTSVGVRNVAKSRVDALVRLEVADNRYEDALECGKALDVVDESEPVLCGW